MELNPRVSVLIVSQSQREALHATLASLAAAAPPPVESEAPLFQTIVVDCGSPDGSSTLDQEFEGITLMRLPRNFGWTRAINIATRTAKGDFLFWLPPGLLVAPDTLPRLLSALEANPQAGAVCPAGSFFALPKPGDTDLQPASPAHAEYPFRQAVLFPRLALTSMNFLPDKYGQNFADLELFRKLREAGKKILVLEDLHLQGEAARTPMIDAESDHADRLSGLSVFYGKNYGFAAGFGFWLSQTFQALLSFRFGLFSKLLSGSKIDGL